MANPGDLVEVKTAEETFKGQLLKRPDLLEENKVILKLDNGYNVGIEKTKVKTIKVIKKHKEETAKKAALPKKKGLPTIAILSTGGTIASKVDYRTGGVKAKYTAEDFAEMCPELAEKANIVTEVIMSEMTEDMRADEWKTIAKAVAKACKKYDGIVLTMGTDTMTYIAGILSFMVKPNIPVVITGAQKSIDRGSSDAFFNLICAVHFATTDCKEVVVCMHATSNDDYCHVLRGTKVRKMHSSRRDAFRPINELPIAHVFGTEKIQFKNSYTKERKTVEEKAVYDENVALVYVHPCMNPEHILNYQKEKGIILMGTGLGHVPDFLYKPIKALVDKGVFVGITSQSIYGRVSGTVYSNLRKVAIECGATHLEDMLPETALVKLGWVCAQEKDPKKIKERMLKNEVGEFSERIVEDTFLI